MSPYMFPRFSVICLFLSGNRTIHYRRSKFTSSIDYIQPDQINMAVFFWYLVKVDSPVYFTVHMYNGQCSTLPCLTGHPVFCQVYLVVLQTVLVFFNQDTARTPIIPGKDSRTNSHQTFDHHKCLKCKSRHKNGEIIKLFR